MNYSKTAMKSILGSAALVVLAAQATAAEETWSGIESEIDSCVSVVADQVDYNDATRIRHAVVGVKERALGYKLNIETSLYSDASDQAIREYKTSCVVNGSNLPVDFSISETNDDA